jgi:hypothetical protein
MMKKSLLFTILACAVIGTLPAQSFEPASYEESTLFDFNAWRLNHSEAGEDKKFKIPVLFNSAEDVSYRFIDAALEEQAEFESEFTWPPMRSGQELTIYVTAWGPWVWDRHLDAVDYGNGRLVQAETGGSMAGRPGSGRAAESEGQPQTAGGRVPGARSAPESEGQPQTTGGRVPGARSAPESEGQPQTAGGAGGKTPGPAAKVPAANPTPAEIASSQEAPAAPAGNFDYGRAPRVAPRQVVVQISGKPPQRGRYYRLQVGAFTVRGNATRAANSLKSAGLNPAFEEYRNNVRVVLPRVPGEDVVETARKIGGAGFSEVWCREEP